MSYLIQKAEEAQKRKLDLQREMADRAAVASGNVDENSALYRHARLNGWAIGKKNDPYSGAGRKWLGADAQSRSRMLDARADMMEADADLRAGYDGIVANATAQRLDRARRGRATLGSIVGHAMRHGGMVPKELTQSVGMELGDPGFVGGTLAKDGTFMSLGRGKKGDIQPTGLVSPMDVTKAMVDSGNWRDAQKYVKQFLKGRLTDQQIATTGFSPQWVQEMVNAQASESDRKLQLEGLKILADMQKGGGESRPVDAVGFYTKNPKLAERFLTDYERDESGNIKMVEGKDGMEPVEVRLSPEEASERAMKYFEGLQKKLAQGGGGENDVQKAIIDGIRALTAPKPADPNAVEMRQRANARANVIDAAGGRQQLIYEQMPDGTLVTTNGYVANGRVYDKNGDERQGQFLDENRRPIVPAAQPAQGGDVHTDERGTWQAVRDANGRVVGKKLIAPAQGGADYGLRNDGKTYKGTGWLGELRLPDGGVATEYTMQSDAVRDANGNRIDFPTLVPTLTKAEQNLMVNDIIPNRKPVPDEIAQKAVDFAKMRLANGQSVFANDGQPLAQGGAASGTVGDMAQPVTTLGGGAQAGTEDSPERQKQREVEERRRAENGPRQRESALRQAGVNEGVAQHYDSIDRETMRRFREAVPDATMADIYSGKYDREIAAAARLADDTSTPSMIEQAQALRSEYKSAQRGKAVKEAQSRFDEEYRSGMDAIRKEADAKGIRGNWSKQERDNYIKREEFMLKNRLRKRLVNVQQAM